ncbi:hypothetical protein [Puerhibacterium puerhi]|uniref:hypothetical protein n=1 Tax=Puerhibacterium puerhi TaxID=2692623 RepID=UPI00135A05D2|nr:hypothetical protein [Puerhibacterium puerhi]
MPDATGRRPPLSPAARRFEWIAGILLALLLLGYWVVSNIRFPGEYEPPVVHDPAIDVLRGNLNAAVTCLQSRPSDLLSANGSAVLGEAMSPCVGTDFLDRDDGTISSLRVRDHANDTLAVSSRTTEDGLVVALVTTGRGTTSSPSKESLITLGTCWQVTVDRDSATVSAPSSAACKDLVLRRVDAETVLEVDDVDLAGAGLGST